MEYIPVVMTRENLTDVPVFDFPAGYAMRAFRPGDGETWVRIWQAAEPFLTITPETFEHQFGADLAAMERRGLFLVGPGGEDVGTITSWFDRSYKGKPWGRIHWVSIVPDHQGRALARPMMTAAMKLLRKFGHRRALLGTQTPRLAAIKTYLDFGFRPDLTAKDAPRAWSLVREALGPHPGLNDVR